MQKKHLVALNPSTGQARANATITVYNAGSSTLASIFDDDETTPLANPLTTDTSGRAAFKAANGDYDITVSGEGFNSYTIDEVQFAEVDDFLTGDFETGLPNHTHESPTQGGSIRALRNADAVLLLVGQINDGEVLVRSGTGIVSLPSLRPTVSAFGGNGTWTKPARLTGVKVTVIGGGGGSGGLAQTSPSGHWVGGGEGGGAGGAIKWIAAASLGATETVTIGGGGAGGGAAGYTAFAGSSGGTTSFGAHVSATGGGGGAGATAAGAVVVYWAGGAGGSYGGSPNLGVDGLDGHFGFMPVSSLMGSGDPFWKQSGRKVGPFGFKYGAGGPCRVKREGAVEVAGADGIAGVCIVEEFYA